MTGQDNVTELEQSARGQIPSGVALLSRYECVLSQVGTHPDMTLNVARI